MTMAGDEEEKGSTSHRLQASMVSLDLASFLFPSLTVPFGRGLCVPELSLADRGACPEGAIKTKSLL